MEVLHAHTAEDRQRWEDFVFRHPESSNFHRWGWRNVITNSFGWPAYYLMAIRDGNVAGVLPLVWQKSLLFGSFFTSLPFLNAGGILSSDVEAANALFLEAVRLAKIHKAKYLELRHRHHSSIDAQMKSNKVSILKAAIADEQELLKSIPHKARSDVRKSLTFGLQAEFGGVELLDPWFEIFVHNMRNLGTPSYSKTLFAQILREFPGDSRLCLVRHEGVPVSGSFLTCFRDTVEALWSCSSYAHSRLKPNMFMYFRIIQDCAVRGFRYFDFGRSTVGGGTHKFKMQWGSEELPLFWNYWVPEGENLPELNPDNPKFNLAIKVWQKLPLAVTRRLGPFLVRRLP
jgi:FemAB-related protein (PEP-CTERM system-associated)